MPWCRSPSSANRAGTVAMVNWRGSTSSISSQLMGVDTIASAYSVRGVPEAIVSTPISWDEIDEVNPRQFTIATVPARFAELGDLHQGIDDSAYSLDTLLEWAERDGLD